MSQGGRHSPNELKGLLTSKAASDPGALGGTRARGEKVVGTEAC